MYTFCICSNHALQAKAEKGALARQRSELQARSDRQEGQLTEARALQATTATALARVSAFRLSMRCTSFCWPSSGNGKVSRCLGML